MLSKETCTAPCGSEIWGLVLTAVAPSAPSSLYLGYRDPQDMLYWFGESGWHWCMQPI